MTTRLPSRLLRLEGAVVAAAAVTLYAHVDGSWWLFLALALAPDLSMVGYLAGPVAGAVAYDFVHTYALPVALGAIGVLADSGLAVEVALVWITHLGVDRALGYGLKYPTGFKDTHLQRL